MPGRQKSHVAGMQHRRLGIALPSFTCPATTRKLDMETHPVRQVKGVAWRGERSLSLLLLLPPALPPFSPSQPMPFSAKGACCCYYHVTTTHFVPGHLASTFEQHALLLHLFACHAKSAITHNTMFPSTVMLRKCRNQPIAHR